MSQIMGREVPPEFFAPITEMTAEEKLTLQEIKDGKGLTPHLKRMSTITKSLEAGAHYVSAVLDIEQQKQFEKILAGNDGQATLLDACCADRCKAFLDGSYRRGKKDAVEKVLEIIHEMSLDEDYGIVEKDTMFVYAEGLCKRVKRLLEEEA